jgi:transposase
VVLWPHWAAGLHPITGNRAKRMLPGVLNLTTGALLLLLTEVWEEVAHQDVLERLRAHGRGWHVVRCEDRGPPHTAAGSQEVARDWGLHIRWRPRATPALNALGHLWRHVKGRAAADRPTRTSAASADAACRSLLEMRRLERLQKAGVLSGRFWLPRDALSKNFCLST